MKNLTLVGVLLMFLLWVVVAPIIESSPIKAFDNVIAKAKELSDDPGSAEFGGDLGWAEPGLFVPEFDKVLFSLEIGQMSEPVQTQFGFHLIKLDDLKEGQQQEFDEISQELDIEYSRLLAEDKLFEKADRLADLSLQAFNELNSKLSRSEGLTYAQSVRS